jgi:signal peptidase II
VSWAKPRDPGSPPADSPRWGGRRLPWLLLISALVFTGDRLSKTWVERHVRIGHAIPILDHVLRISHWTNEGAAFSLFAGSASPQIVRWGLVAFTLLASVVVLVFLLRLGDRITLTTVALALILGGALGNAHDRIVYGSVVDFIEVHIVRYHWPDFNLADSSVVIGACLLFLDSLRPARTAQAKKKTGEQTAGA